MRLPALLLFISTFLPFKAGAQTALLDTSFSGDGLLTWSVTCNDEASALLALPDTSMLIAGTSTDSAVYNEDIVVDKRLPGGNPDPAFGTGGRLRFDFTGFPRSKCMDMVSAGDSMVYLLGRGSDSPDVNRAFCIRAFRFDGSPCNWFGQQGQVNLSFLSSSDLAYAISRQADGKLLVCGMTFLNNSLTTEMPAIARLQPNGVPDSSFGSTGKIALDFLFGVTNARILPGTQVHAWGGYFEDVTALPDGRILCGGAFNNGFYYEGALFMFTAAGVPDSSFNGSGLLRFDLHPGEIQSITKVLVTPDSNWVALQNNQSLQPTDCDLITVNHQDHSYNVDAFDVQNRYDRGYDICCDRYGRLWLTGHTTLPANFTPYYFSDEAFVYCLRPAGGSWMAENTFNGGSPYTFAFDTAQNLRSGGHNIVIDKAGRPLIAGSVYAPGNNSNPFDIALARLDSLPFVSGTAQLPVNGSAIRLFPNPAQDLVFIEGLENANTLLLLDLSGKTIREQNIAAGEYSTVLPLNGLSSGLYFLQLKSSAGISTLKIIVQ